MWQIEEGDYHETFSPVIKVVLIKLVLKKLSQFIASPRLVHWVALKKVLGYLSDMQGFNIYLNKVTSFTVHNYCKVDWVGMTGEGDRLSGLPDTQVE